MQHIAQQVLRSEDVRTIARRAHAGQDVQHRLTGRCGDSWPRAAVEQQLNALQRTKGAVGEYLFYLLSGAEQGRALTAVGGVDFIAQSTDQFQRRRELTSRAGVAELAALKVERNRRGSVVSRRI